MHGMTFVFFFHFNYGGSSITAIVIQFIDFCEKFRGYYIEKKLVLVKNFEKMVRRKKE
jgi:hypothetical protein